MIASTSCTRVTLLLSLSAAFALPPTRSSRPHIQSMPTCIPGKQVTQEERVIALDAFVERLWIKKDVTAAFNDYVLETYIQHNPTLPSGRDASSRGLNIGIPLWNVTIQQKAIQGDISFLHWKNAGLDVPGFFPAARYHAIVNIFRWEGACIAEHWDTIQAAPPADRPNALELL